MTDPFVSVIVPHHLNQNDDYLYWCLTSILASVGVEIDIFCISDAPNDPSIPDDKRVMFVHDPRLSNVTQKWHYGLKLVRPSCKYVMLISDDVMVSKHTIREMARMVGDQEMILSPSSNCDATTRYFTLFRYCVDREKGLYQSIPHKCTMTDIQGYQNEIINYPLNWPILIDPGWVSFYCTLFPRSVIEKVGDFDEALDVRYNDLDYCRRARTLGIRSFIHLGVFALHFGDRTLPFCTAQEEYSKADEAYGKKYPDTVRSE